MKEMELFKGNRWTIENGREKGEKMGYISIVLLAVGVVGIGIGIKWMKKRNVLKEQEQNAVKRMREEALDKALSNPMTKGNAPEMSEQQRRPFQVEYSQGEDAIQGKQNQMFEISEITELSKRKYMFRCTELVSLGNQYGTVKILPSTASQEQVICQLFYYEGENYVRSTGIQEVSLRRKNKAAAVNKNGIKLLTGDVICINDVRFEVLFL